MYEWMNSHMPTRPKKMYVCMYLCMYCWQVAAVLHWPHERSFVRHGPSHPLVAGQLHTYIHHTYIHTSYILTYIHTYIHTYKHTYIQIDVYKTLTIDKMQTELTTKNVYSVFLHTYIHFSIPFNIYAYIHTYIQF